MKCVEDIARPAFTLDDIYAFEPRLAALYPGNHNVRPKIRQQRQVLTDGDSGMATPTVYEEIKRAIDRAPRNGYVAELHLQVLKHVHLFENVSGKDFCAALDIGPAWGTEFAKMKKIAPRLLAAGLNLEKI